MPRKLTDEDADQIWDRLRPRLDPRNVLTGYDGGYPVGFPEHLSVSTSGHLPPAQFLEAVREATRSVGDETLFFLLDWYVEGESGRGLEWEVPLQELSCETLAEIGHRWRFQFYLYSTGDEWAILFHHEDIAFCGGSVEFIQALRRACEAARVEIIKLGRGYW